MSNTRFPQDFVWGVATSAFQIEGATATDGRGESIWDRFASQPGKIEDGTDGARACDHYNRWQEDVDIIASLRVGAYRFSISWPRVFAKGSGPINSAGLAFYDRLVDTLLARDIEPFITLYHWDLPQTLQDKGGWLARDTARYFADYAHEVGRRLGDRAKKWVTHNEPWCSTILGHEAGEHAPGLKDRSKALAAGHHILLSHGLAVDALRDTFSDLEIGIVQLLCPGYPASDSDADVEATEVFEDDFNRWFMDPIAFGRYPQKAVARARAQGFIYEQHPVLAEPNDLEIISAPIDFVGINYYRRAIVRAEIPERDNRPRELFSPPKEEMTDMGWEVYPEGLYDVLKRVQDEWKFKKIFVTECGAAYGDGPDDNGQIRDLRRIKFLDEHFANAERAIADGVQVAGLFVWSLMDNFEWAFGYRKRFGLVWVDYATQERKLKDSAHWFREFIETNGRS
ncbi:MAG: GH1 family beta-glucosidase [Myxococcota bacterium]